MYNVMYKVQRSSKIYEKIYKVTLSLIQKTDVRGKKFVTDSEKGLRHKFSSSVATSSDVSLDRVILILIGHRS